MGLQEELIQLQKDTLDLVKAVDEKVEDLFEVIEQNTISPDAAAALKQGLTDIQTAVQAVGTKDRVPTPPV